MSTGPSGGSSSSNNSTSSSSSKYVLLSLQQRLEIVRKLEDGVSIGQLVKDYSVSSITIRRIKKNAVEIRQRLQIPGADSRWKMRKPVLQELDARLFAWYKERKATGSGRVTDAILQEKAKELNAEFGGPSTFSASKGWIWRFKNRHAINLTSKPHGDSVNADTRATEEFAQSFVQRLEEEGIKLQNVYNMDETGLAWKALPQKTLLHAAARRVYGDKIKRDRVTVALCANATGTHKLPPLFIHENETPTALKHCRDRLPVVFKARKNAWVDRNLFTDWLENHFKPAVRMQQFETGAYGKVLLLIDNCDAHAVQQWEDDNVEVVLLPANPTTKLLPMDQGIIKRVKRSFRHGMLRRILEFPGTAEFYADYDVKDCIDLVNEAWMNVTPVTICNSWKKLLGVEATTNEETGEERKEKHPCDMLDIIAISETVGTIAGEMVAHKEIEEWLATCEEAEGAPDDLEDEEEDEDEEEKCSDRGSPVHMDEDELERTFTNIILWSESQSDFVKLHARVLKDYYDLVQK